MTKPPQERPPLPKGAKTKGLIIVHTGDGKGKTTAALGVAFRAAGHKFKVSVLQFIKGHWKYGELEAAKKHKPYLEIIQLGEGFTWDTKDPERDKALVAQGWGLCKEKLFSEKYNLLVFDEINYVMDYGYLNSEEVIEALKKKPRGTHVILTGRNAPASLVEIADLVTEMREIKHPFKDQGIIAQKGIEF